MKKIIRFFYQDKVFLIAFIAAVVSVLFVPINRGYIDYINIEVLVVMFSLMLSVQGMTDQRLFNMIAVKMVKHLKDMRVIALIIIMASFFLGMLLTNDAVLLTLVPFMLFVLAKINRSRESIIIVILMTIAANLGSALTPMGDPQNIYLYTNYNLDFWEFIKNTSVITITGFILLVLTVLLIFKQDLVEPIVEEVKIKDYRLVIYFIMFLVAILTVLGIIPAWISLIIVVVLGLIFGKEQFKKVDYQLLLTFVMFFIFTGNISQMGTVKNFFQSFLNNEYRVFFMGILVSQVISNVPAAILLSKFTPIEFMFKLLQGVNIGAMGTIIGSLASLITFKFVTKLYPERFKEYLIKYTIICIIYMGVIIGVVYLFK
ncbi:MAG: SLC13 family permease [Acholeplasmataceae bacterium]|nr:SLC13 family permease [Acholeplasmataceae bacterium]